VNQFLVKCCLRDRNLACRKLNKKWCNLHPGIFLHNVVGLGLKKAPLKTALSYAMLQHTAFTFNMEQAQSNHLLGKITMTVS